MLYLMNMLVLNRYNSTQSLHYIFGIRVLWGFARNAVKMQQSYKSTHLVETVFLILMPEKFNISVTKKDNMLLQSTGF